jgi:hypothetical protein
LGLYDCPDDTSDDLAFSGSILDDDGNPLEAETAAQPPDRSGAGANAHIASQDAHRQPQDTASLSTGCNNNVAMGSCGFGGGSSDDSSSNSSSGRDSAHHSVSSHWHRHHKQRCSKGHSGPPWDRFGDWDKFSHRKSKREIKSGCCRKGFVKGMMWMHYLFVPSLMLIDPDTHVHLPWLATHPTHGHMLCHPVNVAHQFANLDLFLSNFNRVPQQTDVNQAQKGHAAFVKTFLVFQQATSLIAYCYEIVSYNVNFGHYFPPPFTITINEPLGTLFVSLPSIYQTYSLQTTSGTLAEAFKNLKTKLITLDSFTSHVTGSDSYCMFRNLVALSGQPSLDPYATLPLAPLQTVDQSILDHLHNSKLYLDKLLMHGQWLSDQYFIESLHTSAKPEMWTKFMAQLWNDMKSDCLDIDKPMPAKYYPHNLWTAFVMIVRGEYGDQKVALMLVREMTRG